MITEIKYNHTPAMVEISQNGNRSDIYPEEYELAIVGENGVGKIVELIGDRDCFEIHYPIEIIRTYAPYTVKYKKEQK